MNSIKISKAKIFILLAVIIGSIFLLTCKEEHEDISPLSLIPIESVLGNGRPTLAEFGWRKCVPCITMRPILEELAEEYKETMNVIIIDLPLREDLAEKYNIRVMPVQIIFDDDGNELIRHSGAISKAAIIEQLNIMSIYRTK